MISIKTTRFCKNTKNYLVQNTNENIKKTRLFLKQKEACYSTVIHMRDVSTPQKV